MDEMQRGIITLLRCAVTGESLPLPERFSIENAYPILRRHSVLLMAYDGAVKCGISADQPVMQKMFQVYLQQLLRSEQQMKAVDQLFSDFEAAGVDYLPIKGCITKRLYPKPELRSMGDADILIRMEDYDKIMQILASRGYTMELECNHTLNYISPTLYLELHRRLVPTTEKDLFRYFGEGWDRARLTQGHRYDYPPEDMYLYLFAHFVKHYRHGGIGCRHMTDLWVYRRSHPEMDMNYLDGELEELGLLQFHRNLIRTIEMWFADGTEDEMTDWITDVIFRSGNWGKREDHTVANHLKLRSESGKSGTIRGYSVFRMLFPKAEVLEYKYPFLEKRPWLLPVAWVLRWVEVLRKRPENIARRFRGVKLATDERLTEYEEGLRYVGLEYQADSE